MLNLHDITYFVQLPLFHEGRRSKGVLGRRGLKDWCVQKRAAFHVKLQHFSSRFLQTGKTELPELQSIPHLDKPPVTLFVVLPELSRELIYGGLLFRLTSDTVNEYIT